MKTYLIGCTLAAAAMLAGAPSVQADVVLFYDNFSGGSGNLDNASADTNVGNPTAMWDAHQTFNANGTVALESPTTSNGQDYSAWINLGSGTFQPNSVYRLTVDIASVSGNNAIFLVGFSDVVSPNPDARGQTQTPDQTNNANNGNFSISFNRNGTSNVGLNGFDAPGDAPTALSDAAFNAGVFSMLISVNGAGVGTMTLEQGSNPVLGTTLMTNVNHLYLGYESASSPTLTLDLNSITLTQIPAPAALPAGLAMLAIAAARRRR